MIHEVIEHPEFAQGVSAVTRKLWQHVSSKYLHSKAAEDAFYATYIDPFVPEDLQIGPERRAAVNAVGDDVWKQAEALTERLLEAECMVLAVRPPNEAAAELQRLIRVGHLVDFDLPSEWLTKAAVTSAEAA